jgi:hypothetical protein
MEAFAATCAAKFRPGGEFTFSPPTPGLSADVSPAAFQLQPLCLIDPWQTYEYILGKRPPCPVCSSTEGVERQGWSSKGPRRVMDTHSCVWVLAKVFKCKCCPSRLSADKLGYTFQSIDVRLTQQVGGRVYALRLAVWTCAHAPSLPPQIALDYPWISRSYPFTFTHKLAVTAAVMQDLRHALGTSMAFEALAKKYREQHHISYTEARMGYAQHALAVRKLAITSLPDLLTGARDVPKFGEFDDLQGYAGKSPAAQYLIALALVVHNRLHSFLTTRNMMVLGEYLRGDNSFKLAKKIMSDGTRPFLCVYTVLNEYNEVLGSWCSRTSSLDQARCRQTPRLLAHLPITDTVLSRRSRLLWKHSCAVTSSGRGLRARSWSA